MLSFISYSLVKLGFLDDSVWADALLVFYEVFRYLEGAMIRLRNTKIGLLPLSELQRTEAFERDLDHYLGKGWRKNYSPRYTLCMQHCYHTHIIVLKIKSFYVLFCLQ